MSVRLQKMSREDEDIWHGMLTHEVMDLPLEEARDTLMAYPPAQTLGIMVEGERVGFVLGELAPGKRADLLWVFIRKKDRGKGWATAAVGELMKTYGGVHLQGAPRGWGRSLERHYEVEGLEDDEPFVDLRVMRRLG
jgi:ribosomal protein S18 acetylase RimI-like enzyme